jgi:hypothetical protein
MLPISDILDAVSTAFSATAGWAWETVVGGMTDWVAKGVLALLMALWNFMDTASSPRLDSEWFSGSAGSPFETSFGIGVMMVSLLIVLAIIRAVAAGSPGAIFRAVGRDLPLAVFSMVSLVAVTVAAVDVSDGISYFIWDQTRDDAIRVLDAVALSMMGGLMNLHFAGIVVGLLMMLAMLFMWVVLFVREALIYIVVAFAVSFGLPAMVFPPLRDSARKVVELIVALIIAKPVMILALSVAVSALGGIGATGEPGDGVGDNVAAELGTLITGVVAFGLAAFMPFLVWKLMPIVAAAAIAQGIASGPLRGTTQTMQLQYYGRSAMNRLAGSSAAGAGGSISLAGAGAAGPVGLAAAGAGAATASASRIASASVDGPGSQTPAARTGVDRAGDR